jgi:DNA-binding NarL/FixJ family response regulator
LGKRRRADNRYRLAPQALEAGVRGYVLKRSAVENLVQAIRAANDAARLRQPRCLRIRKRR